MYIWKYKWYRKKVGKTCDAMAMQTKVWPFPGQHSISLKNSLKSDNSR